MRNLYVKQVDYMSTEKRLELKSSYPKEEEQLVEDITQEEDNECWITIEEFFERSHITKDKKKRKVLKRLQKAYKKEDKRVKKDNGILLISCYDFYEDILKKKF